MTLTAPEVTRLERTVSHVVRLCHVPPQLREDTRQEAWVGVMQAVRDFDPGRFAPFRAHA